MSAKSNSTIAFLAANSASLTALSFVVAYSVFSPASGWQLGFAVVLLLQAAFLSVLSTVAFFLGQRVFQVKPSAGQSALHAIFSVAVALGLAFLSSLLIEALFSIWVFYLLLMLGPFLTPGLAKRYFR